MSTSKAQQSTAELHAAIYTTQTLLKQAADVIEHNMKSLAESHTHDGIVKDVEVQLMLESDADLIAELRAAAQPWDQRHKSTERPPKRAHKFTPEQVAAVRADLLGAMQAHGIDTQNSETVTQTFEGLPMRKLKVLLTAGWAINGVSIERQGLGGVPGRGAVTTGGMVLWWNPPAGQAVPETNFGDMAAPVQPVGTYGEIYESMQALLRTGLQRDQQIYIEMKDKPLYTAAPVQDMDYKSLYEQMCERCDLLDKALGEYESAAAAPVQPVAQSLKDAVFTVLEGFTLPHDVRKILESAYYNPPAQTAPVISAGPITPEMANWSESDKADLAAVMARHLTTPPAAQPATCVGDKIYATPAAPFPLTENLFVRELREYAQRFHSAHLFPGWDVQRALKHLGGYTTPPAQPEPVQELVACQYGDGGYACCEGGPCKADEQNNAAQPEPVPLTDEAMDNCLRRAGIVATYEALRRVGREVEAAHGITKGQQ